MVFLFWLNDYTKRLYKIIQKRIINYTKHYTNLTQLPTVFFIMNPAYIAQKNRSNQMFRYSLHYAQACSEFAGLTSTSLCRWATQHLLPKK